MLQVLKTLHVVVDTEMNGGRKGRERNGGPQWLFSINKTDCYPISLTKPNYVMATKTEKRRAALAEL